MIIYCLITLPEGVMMCSEMTLIAVTWNFGGNMSICHPNLNDIKMTHITTHIFPHMLAHISNISKMVEILQVYVPKLCKIC